MSGKSCEKEKVHAEVRRVSPPSENECPKSDKKVCPPPPPPPPEIPDCPEPCIRDNLLVGAPAFDDLDKEVKGVFGNNFLNGLLKLDVKTKTEANMMLHASGQATQEEEKVVSGAIEMKYVDDNYGATFVERWTTDNTLASEVKVENQGVIGLKFGANFIYSPETSKKDWKGIGGFEHKNINLNTCMDITGEETIIKGDVVLNLFGVLAGYQAYYNPETKDLTKSTAAFGFNTSDLIFIAHGDLKEDPNVVHGSIYQKVSPDLETALHLQFNLGDEKKYKGAVALKYNIGCDATISAKVDNERKVGIAYKQKLCEGIHVTMSGELKTQSFEGGGHLFGVGLEMEH